jgi:pimeloyl-ACP methyl ester carboxylesterase
VGTEYGREPIQTCENAVVSHGQVRYARNGDVHIAYRVLGDGDLSLVFVPGYVGHVDLYDDAAYPFAPLVEHLAQRTRLILWDKRGTGLSDPVTRVPTLDERMEDLHAVLDAVGADSPAMFGVSEGGPLSILFAATFPERARSLVLYGTAARFVPELPHFPWGFSSEFIEASREAINDHWGEGQIAAAFWRRRRHASGAGDAGRVRTRVCKSGHGGHDLRGDGQDRRS